MRTFALALTVALAALSQASSASACCNDDGTLIMPELEFEFSREAGIRPQAGLTAGIPLGNGGGLMFDARLSEEAGGAYVGPALVLGPISLGIPLLGATSYRDETHYRPRLIFIFEGEDLSVIGMGDMNLSGGEDSWAKVEAAYRVHEHVALGGQAQSDVGIGPRVELLLGKGVTAYSAWTYAWWNQEVIQFMGVRAIIL